MSSSLEITQNSLNSAIQTYFLAVEYFGANSPQAAASLANANASQRQLDETYQAMLAADRQAAEQEAARLLAERQAAVDEENARIAAQQEAARVAAQQEAARVAAQQEAARVEAARAEAAAQEAARVAAQQEAARVEAARVAAQQEAARVAAQQEAARVEAARVAAQVVQAPPPPPPEVTEGIANNLMYRAMTGGVPTSEFDKYGGYAAVRAKSTLTATPKAIGEYEQAMGLPESEYTKVNKEYAASGKSKDTIVSEITALVPASGSITYESLVNYANNNNLQFQSIANALEGKFKDTTPQQIVDNLNFEDDRLALNRLATTKKVDGKDVTSVDLADAIKAASQGLVSPENLAKFFGKTPAEMASFVSSNLDYIADNLRDNGIDPSKSLNSMFGIAADKVTQSINKIDIQEGLNALAGTDGKISFDAALDYAKTKNLSNDELAGYLGVTPKAITDYVKESGIRSGLNALADSSGNITFDAALDFADDKDMTIDELASYLGVNANTITEYKTDKELNQLKTFVNGVLTSEDKNIGEQAASIKTYLQQNKLSEKDLASATGYSDAQVSRLLNPISREQAIQNYLKSSDATGLYELDAALAGSAYDRSRFNEIPEADKQAFISAYTKAGGTSTGALAEIANLYQPGMTLQQLLGSVIGSRQSDAEAAANTVFLDVSGKPITGENVNDLYRISSFVGYDPATGKPIRAVGSSQGQYFYDPDAGSRVATLLNNQRKFEQAGGKFGTFIEGTDIPYSEMHSTYVKDGYYGYDPEKLTPQQRNALGILSTIRSDYLLNKDAQKWLNSDSARLLNIQREYGLSDSDLIGFASHATGISPSDIQKILDDRSNYVLVEGVDGKQIIHKDALNEFAALTAEQANLNANAPYGRDPVTGMPYTKEQRMNQVQMDSVRGDFFGRVGTDPKAAVKAVMDRIERNELSEGESAAALGMTMEELAGYARYYASTPAEYDRISRIFGKDEYGNWTGAQSIKAYPTSTSTSSGTTVKEQGTPVIDYKSPIYMQAFTQGIMKRTDLTDAQKSVEINNYKNQYGVTNEQLASATGYTAQQVNDFLSQKTTTPPTGAALSTGPSEWTETQSSEQAWGKEYARLLSKGLSDSQIQTLFEKAIGSVGYSQWNRISTAGKAIAAEPVKTTAAPATATTAAPTTESILNGLKAFADKDGKITFDAALNYASSNKIPIADVAKAINVTPEALTKYSTDKQISSGLQTAAGQDNQLSYDEILNYTAANNYKLEDIVKYIGTADSQPELLTGLKKYVADKPIIEGLQTAAGQDKQLSYSEIVDFASKNNMDLSNVVNYIGTEDKRSDLLTSLQNYVKEEGFKSSLSDTKLTDYKGNQYAANDLLKLADQVKQNFDTKNSSGGVFKTSGESVGFDYSEAKKLFPEGKNPTVFDQVALDIARGLLNAGIKDVSELSKYKPTEVTELDYNVEAGSPIETKVTKLINPETGEEAPNLGATYTGEGGTLYNFTVDASGKPVFGTTFEDTSDKGQIAILVAFGAAILAPQILPELIGAAPAAVAGVEGAVAQAALGGTGLTGSLMAAGIPASVAGYAATAIVNGVYNGLVSEVTGGDFEKGFIAGGVAPVMGQLTANAVNSITTGLPAGVSSAVGNAVTQLISTGEIDLGQVALAGARPTVINTIVDASGGSLTAPQARLLLETVASGGKNITSLAQNPAGVVNFVLKNQDAFKNLSTAAATNTAQKPPAVDLSGLDTVQKEVLTSTPRTETIQGEALFKDINTTELGSEIAATGIVRPPGEMISTDMSKPVTGVDEFAGYDNALQFAQALISGDPSALAKMAGTAGEDTGVGQLSNKDAIAQIREAQRTGALDYYNLSQAQLEAMLIERAPTLEQAREMAELAYGKGASFRYGGKFYEGTQQTPTQTQQAVQIKDSGGKVFDVPANATLNKNSSGAIVGYTHNGTTYEYQNGKMVPLASTALPEKYTLEDVRKLSLDGLTKLYESIDPNAHKQTTIPGTGQVVTPYQAWLVRYGKNPEAAVAELNATAPVKDASVLQTISKNIGNVVQELRSSDNSYVRSVGDKLATNATYLGEAVKGAATTLSSPVELFNAIAFGDPTNPISQWASGVRSDITAAQASVDPDWQKTKSFINEQLTKIGADQGQIAQFVAGADLYANNPRALGDFFWTTVPTAIPGVAAYSALTRFGVPIAYAGGAFAAATGSQTDLVPMADATYQNILEQVKRDNPNISERDAQEKAAAGTAVSMRAAGLISLAGSTAIQLLPGSQAGGVLARAVTREIGQEVGDESWVKVLSNAWQGKELQTDMGRTVLEAVLASGPISTAANLLTNQYGTTYNQDQVVRDLNWELENATPTFNQGVKVLTGPNNQPILNSANQPILLTYDQKPGLTFDEDPNKPGPSPTELNKSSPTESIFDVIFDNEQNGGYYVNSVSLDGKSYTVTDKDGSTKVINTDQLLNNALNIVTQQNPGAYQTLLIDNPLEALLSEQIARNVDLGAINQNNQLANIITTNQKGAFAITDSGTITFVPNKLANVDTKIDFQIGDSVVIGQGLALPVKKEVTTGGQVTFKPDSSLDLGVTFGPIFAEVQTNTGTALVNTTAPNVSTGTVVSIDPSTQTALVSTNTGNPFLVNLFGYNPNIGSNLFFNATTGDVIGAPLVKPPIGELGGLPPPVIEGGIMGPSPVVDINQPPAVPLSDVTTSQPVDTSFVNTSVNPSFVNPPSTELPPVVAPPIIVDTVPPPPPPVVPPTITPPATDLPPTISPPTITPPGVDVPTVNVPTGSVTTTTSSIPIVKPPVTQTVTTNPPIITTTTQPKPWDLPVVPPPELSGSFQMPYPNYLRPLDPYLGYGIGALMGDLYDEVSRDGGYQPVQNAQGQIKIPT